MKDDSNPTQTWRRIRDQAIRGLILLAKKLPEEKQQGIFDNKIRNFFSSVLGTAQIDYNTINLQYPAHNYLDYRRTRLAAIGFTKICNHH